MSIIKDLKNKRAEIGTHQLSNALGLSESTIRVIVNGHYKGSLEPITNAFNQLYTDSYQCLHSQESIKQAECESRAQSPRPLGGASKQAWWETCQSCERTGN